MTKCLSRWILMVVSTVAATALFLISGTINAHAQSPAIPTAEINRQIDEVSIEITNALRASSEAMKITSSGNIEFNSDVLRQNGASESDIAEVQTFVDQVNSRPHYKDRSWYDYGKCVVLAVTGAEISTDISAEIDWNAVGKAIKKREWSKVVSHVKSGVNKFIKKKGPKALAKKGAKQLLGLSPWGLAAKAVYAAGYCAL